jgi:Tol biopolymer transport system component
MPQFLPIAVQFLLAAGISNAVTLAYIDTAGHVIYKPEGAPPRVIETKNGYDLCLSRDGKRLLYARGAADGPNRTMVLYDAPTGKSRDVMSGLVSNGRWSPDSTQVSFFKMDRSANAWQLWIMPAVDPSKATVISKLNLDFIVDWTPDNKTVIVGDGERIYWFGVDGKQQKTVPIMDVYGKEYQWMSSDVLRFQPGNPGRMSMSVYYMETPKDVPFEETGGFATVLIYDWSTKKKTALLNTKTFGHDAVWTPDGAWLYYTRQEKLSKFAVWRMHPDGTGQERIVAGMQPSVAE